MVQEPQQPLTEDTGFFIKASHIDLSIYPFNLKGYFNQVELGSTYLLHKRTTGEPSFVSWIRLDKWN